MSIIKTSIFFCLLILTACSPSATQEQKPVKNVTDQDQSAKKETTKNIIFFGDSITAAYKIDTEDGYVAILQDKANALGMNYKMVNAGNSGETTAGGLTRIDWILKQRADILVLELGANDGLRGIEPEETKKNLQSIIDKIRAKNAETKIIIAAMEALPNMGEKFRTAFRNVFIDLAKENQITYLPFMLENVAGIKEMNLPDGMHPNEEGQKIVAENVWATLKTIL